MKPPLVSAILPFSDSRRLNLVRKTVNNFIRQNYTPYELIIVNSTDMDVLTNQEMDTKSFQEAGCQVLEVRAPRDLCAAAMRNRGIVVAHGDWIFPIDDDDWCHPQRLVYQMSRRRENHPCLLKYQLRIDISPSLIPPEDVQPGRTFKPLLQLLKIEEGIPPTILFPRLINNTHGELWLYNEELNIGEHDELLARMKQDGAAPVVCDNMHNTFVNGMHWPILSIAIFHTSNELTREQFFPNFTRPDDPAAVPVGLMQSDMNQLKTVLKSYNFSIQ